MMTAAQVRAYVRARAPKLNLDPNAVLAVAGQEGIGGGRGDNNTSFGPWQLHAGGALPNPIWERGADYAHRWAWSKAGIDYALGKIASVAAGRRGPEAVRRIVFDFERPADPQGEYERATASLGKVAKQRGGGVPPPTMLGALSSPPQFKPTGMPDLTSAISASLGQIAMGAARPTETLGGVVEASLAPAPQAISSALGLPREVRDKRGHPATKAAQAPDPGGGWGGTYRPATQLANVAKSLGLTSTSEKRDRKSTASGGVSDHWVGSKDSYAYDLSGSVERMDEAAVVLARRLGIKYRKGQPLVATVTRNGLRYQLLYRTQVGGNHDDHIHLGVRRVG